MNLDDFLDRVLSPKFVLVLFALTACVGFLWGKLDVAVFGGALGTVLGYFYGSKQGEAAANLINAAQNSVAAATTVATATTTKGNPESVSISTSTTPNPPPPKIGE